ncbi:MULTISPECIES: DedA family protein [unclassified Streptomyces]|uniref:DedA family protein n=1 Tax=unclassified Streptomyces TaxID=2593676 RepID=UPI00202E035C|nr:MULTISPECIES: DedA family protein [unclassified Streptomyces]MCM1966788.1 DedA family protein [Streptomyces sp. G1]MCX5126198.1 DedA family protein [Streptomyces sp. NBC_00347]
MIEQWLETIPAVSIYLLVGLVIGLESLGIPLPGEIVLVSSALLASQQGHIDPVVLGICATIGAIVGDSIGYAIGRRGGKPMLERLGRRFPKHFGPDQVAMAERSFEKWGMWAVFFGRFVALLRIFAGPLAGVLHMPYWRFLIANVLGGILWAGGTTAVIYSVGKVAEPWLKGFSWVGLALALGCGLAMTLVVRGRMKKAAAAARAEAGTDAAAADAAAPDMAEVPGQASAAPTVLTD